MTTYRLMDGASGRPGVGSSGTVPPSAGTSYSGSYLAGLVFQVTSGGLWFEGYWWWVPATTSQTTAQKFCLWQVDGSASGTLVPNSTVTSGTLTAGAWNFVALATPLLLPPGIIYTAATGFVSTTGFPDTQGQFGSGDPYSAGITNGPLSAYSSYGGSAAVPGDWQPQQPFSTGFSDPTAAMPGTNDADDLLWLDVQVSDTPPSGATYRTWPNMPVPIGISVPNTSNDYTLGMEFSVSQACTLKKIWHYSPTGSAVLPSRCGIWNVSTTTEVSGTDNSSPAWKDPSGSTASAGDGWVYCDYSSAGVTLSSGVNYKVSTFYGASTTNKWLAVTTGYWTSGGPGASGFTAGPLSVPNSAGASPGQDSWNNGSTWTYPATSSSPENDWIDVEVAPSGGTSHTATASLTVTPSLSAPRTRGKNRTGALSVTPVLDALRRRSRFRTGTLPVAPVLAATGQKAGAARTATASLMVIPSFAAARQRGHRRTATLTVEPSLSAGRARGKFRSALLAVTAAFTAARHRSQFRSASLPVSPVLHATAGHTSGNAHTAAAALTVAPVLAATRSHGHARISHLTVSPAFVTGRTVAHTRMGALVIHPSLGAVVSGGSAPAATFQTGSWWGLDTVLKQSRQEFDAYRSAPPLACPDDGEPLMNAPATNAGSGKELYCRYCGWSYPRDFVMPSRPGW